MIIKLQLNQLGTLTDKAVVTRIGMLSWVFRTHLKAVLLLESGAGQMVRQSVKAEFPVQIALSECSPWLSLMQI